VDNLAKSLDKVATAMTEVSESIKVSNEATAAHTESIKDERKAFAQNATRIVKGIFGLGAFIALCSGVVAWRTQVYAEAAEQASEAASARVERLALAVNAAREETREAREETREARDAVAEQPRLEIVPAASASGSRPAVVLVAPVAKPSHAKAGAPLPPPSASVVLPVDVAPSTGAAGLP
jgi:hypothetical protein